MKPNGNCQKRRLVGFAFTLKQQYNTQTQYVCYDWLPAGSSTIFKPDRELPKAKTIYIKMGF